MGTRITFDHLQAIFDTKNKDYGDAYEKFGNIMKALFPDGIVLNAVDDFEKFAILNHIITKLIRISNLQFIARIINHESIDDTCNDLSIYSQMFKKTKGESHE